MAFGEKYRGETYTNNGGHYYVKIYQDGWTGSTTNIDIAANGLTLDYPAASDIFEPIRGSSLTIKAISPTDFFWEDFFDTNFGDFKVELYNIDDAVIEWEGFNSSEIYSEPFEVYPYPVTLRFVDGLAELKNIDFPDPNGYKHVIQILRLCLNQINDLLIMDCYDVFENSHTSTIGNSALVQTYLDSSTYKKVVDGIEEPMNCYEVLKAVLKSFAITLTQYNGRWWVYRPRKLDQLSFTWKRFLHSTGTESNTTVDAYGTQTIGINLVGSSSFVYGTSVRHVGGSGTLTINEKIKRIKYIYQPFKDKTLLKNTLFALEYGLNDSSLPYGWSENNLDLAPNLGQVTNNDYLSEVVGEQYNIRFVDLGRDESLSNNEYIYQTVSNIYVDTNDKISFRTDFQLLGWSAENRPALIRVNIKLTDTTTNTDYYFGEVANGVIGWGLNSSTYFYKYFYLSDGVQSIEYSPTLLGDLPFTGKGNLTVKIYKPNYPNTYDTVWCLLKNFSVEYLPNADVSGGLFTYTQELDNFTDTYEWDVFHGEGTNIAANGAMRASDLSLLTEWGAGLDSIHEVVVSDILTIKSGLTKQIDIDIEGKLIPFQRIKFEFNQPSGLNNVYMTPIGYTWDIMSDIYSCSMHEVREIAYSPISTTEILSGIFQTPILPLLDRPLRNINTTLTSGETVSGDSPLPNYFA